MSGERLVLLGLAFVFLVLVLAGCQHTAAPAGIAAPGWRAACGAVRPWAPGWQQRLAATLRPLPRDHVFWDLARDAMAARDAVRICRGETRHG